jgi:hypothetical protein
MREDWSAASVIVVVVVVMVERYDGSMFAVVSEQKMNGGVSKSTVTVQ